MPRKCCVPGCKSNYRSTLKTVGPISVFHIPKNEIYRKKWLDAIPRSTWTPSKFSAVCRLHFTNEDVLNPKDMDYQRFQLKEHAVPSIFGNFHDLVNSSRNIKKKTDTDLIENFSDLVNKYPRKVELNEHWNCKLIDNMFHFFTMEVLDDDVNIKNQISVLENLDLSVFVNNTKIDVCELECFSSSSNSKLTRWSQLQFLLKALSEESQTETFVLLSI